MIRAEAHYEGGWRNYRPQNAYTSFNILLIRFCLLLSKSLALLINGNIFTITGPEYLEQGIEKMSASKNMLNTLYRIKNCKEYEYILRGDKGVGLEVRRDIKTRIRKEVNCRSLPPLMRSGLIDFVSIATDMSRYYRVRITEDGETVLKDNS